MSSIKLQSFHGIAGADFLEAALESVDEVFPWLPWCHPAYSLEEADAWVTSQAELFDRRENFEFAVVSESGRFLGGCGLNQIDTTHRRANLGYWIRTSASGGGAATAAVSEIVRFAFTETDLARLEILCAVGNRASQRVAEKAGATREGVLHDRLLVRDTYHDAVIYAVLKSTWSRP